MNRFSLLSGFYRLYIYPIRVLDICAVDINEGDCSLRLLLRGRQRLKRVT